MFGAETLVWKGSSLLRGGTEAASGFSPAVQAKDPHATSYSRQAHNLPCDGDSHRTSETESAESHDQVHLQRPRPGAYRH